MELHLHSLSLVNTEMALIVVNHFPWNTRTYTVNDMAPDDLLTQGSRTSAAMVLT